MNNLKLYIKKKLDLNIILNKSNFNYKLIDLNCFLRLYNFHNKIYFLLFMH